MNDLGYFYTEIVNKFEITHYVSAWSDITAHQINEMKMMDQLILMVLQKAIIHDVSLDIKEDSPMAYSFIAGSERISWVPTGVEMRTKYINQCGFLNYYRDEKLIYKFRYQPDAKIKDEDLKKLQVTPNEIDGVTHAFWTQLLRDVGKAKTVEHKMQEVEKLKTAVYDNQINFSGLLVVRVTKNTLELDFIRPGLYI